MVYLERVLSFRFTLVFVIDLGKFMVVLPVEEVKSLCSWLSSGDFLDIE